MRVMSTPSSKSSRAGKQNDVVRGRRKPRQCCFRCFLNVKMPSSSDQTATGAASRPTSAQQRSACRSLVTLVFLSAGAACFWLPSLPVNSFLKCFLHQILNSYLLRRCETANSVNAARYEPISFRTSWRVDAATDRKKAADSSGFSPAGAS